MSKAAPSRPRTNRAKRVFCIVASRFNAQYVDGLIDHTTRELRALAPDATISLQRVPGSFEIPLCALKAAKSGKFDAVICLGVIIRGQTPHFEYISAAVSLGIARVAYDYGIPVIFGILTTNTEEEAEARSGVGGGMNREGARPGYPLPFDAMGRPPGVGGCNSAAS